jgi:hypothetical protein
MLFDNCFVALSVVLLGCSTAALDASLGTPRDAGAADQTDAANAAASQKATDVGCRWVGYGIGPFGQGQCDVNHLTSHSLLACEDLGGRPTATRTVADACKTQADEVQLFCCPQSSGQTLAASGTDSINNLNNQLTAESGESRWQLLEKAAAWCGSKRLGDWSILYNQDGVTPFSVQFGCH